MKSNGAFTITFNYFNEECSVQILPFRQSDTHYVYELRFKQLRYLLLNEHSEWCFIADIHPCEQLKTLIIKAIEDTQVKPLLKLCK